MKRPILRLSIAVSMLAIADFASGDAFIGYGVKQRRNPDGSFPFVGGQRYEIFTDMSDPDSLQLVQNGKNTFSATDLETFKTNGVVNLNLNLHVFACHLSNKPKKSSWSLIRAAQPCGSGSE